MKKYFVLFLCLSVLLVTGCGKTTSSNEKKESNKEEVKEEEKSKGNCSVLECIEKIDSKNTYEEVNSIIGFEGTLKSDEETYKVYNWELTKDTSISIQFMLKTSTAVITANYPNSMVSKTADFSKWDEIQSKLKSKDGLTYDQFVELVGGVKGVISKKTSSDTTYKWLNSNGGYLSGYFSNATGKCTMATGRF